MRYGNNSELDRNNQESALWRESMKESYSAGEVRRLLRVSPKRLAHLRRSGHILFGKASGARACRYPKFQFNKKVRPYLWRVLHYTGARSLTSSLNALYYRRGDKAGTSLLDMLLAGRGEEAVRQAKHIREFNKKKT